MPATMPIRPEPFKRRQTVSPYVRLAKEWKLARVKSARDQLPEIVRRTAVAVEVFTDAGDYLKASEIIGQVERAGNRGIRPLLAALHEAEIADSAEQLSQETFRDRLNRDVATDEDAAAYIQRSVAARRRAEEAEAAVQAWRDARKAVLG